jgi:RNA polymerase sigma-70 factor (ECF subfamily)
MPEATRNGTGRMRQSPGRERFHSMQITQNAVFRTPFVVRLARNFDPRSGQGTMVGRGFSGFRFARKLRCAILNVRREAAGNSSTVRQLRRFTESRTGFRSSPPAAWSQKFWNFRKIIGAGCASFPVRPGRIDAGRSPEWTRESQLTTDESVRIDSAAVTALYAAHANELRAFLIGVLRDVDLANEALQATFGKVVELGHTAREESLKGWLFRVAFHEALAQRRRRSVEQRSFVRLRDMLRSGPETPVDRLERDETARQVRLALGRLNPEQRIIVQKKLYEDKTFAVIARELNLPLGTVLTRMRTALRNLRNDLRGTQ